MTSYFTVIERVTTGSGIEGTNTANIIGWLGLIVLDTDCVQAGFCQTAPAVTVDQSASSCS